MNDKILTDSQISGQSRIEREKLKGRKARILFVTDEELKLAKSIIKAARLMDREERRTATL